MADAATMTAAAVRLAEQIRGVAATAPEGVLLCGLIAACLASDADGNDPLNAPTSLANTLMVGFNSAMAISTAGRVVAPRRMGMGMMNNE